MAVLVPPLKPAKRSISAATRGTFSATSAVTAADGTATVMIYSTSAGPATISAADSTNAVSAQVLIDFVATTPAAIAMQASPDERRARRYEHHHGDDP